MPLPDSDDGVAETAPSSKEQTPLAPAQPLADLEHPWLGLESFREETRAYFFGRDAEIAELHLRLRSDPLLVLYGRSGLGKTSILLAGLIPRLRAEGRSPLLLRLWYGESAQDVSSQLISAVFGWGDRQSCPIHRKPRPTTSQVWTQRLSEKLGLSLPDDITSRLWLRLHYRDEPPAITHLILDQFEEVFTLGVQKKPGAEEKVRDTLAILLQGAVPASIGRLISEHDSFSDHFDPDSVPVRVILALRSDYVYALNRWRRHLPALGQNSFELRALRGPAAFDAVFKPGDLRCHHSGEFNEENRAETGISPIITQETAQRIVRFVAQKGEEVPIEEIEAVPPILSLLCRELNERRFTEHADTPEKPAAQITFPFHESVTNIETIIAAFYERCVAGRPKAVRIFVEEELVSRYSGARLQQDERSILKVFTDGCEVPGAIEDRRAAGFGDVSAARACLEDLVNERLLTVLDGGENPSYELIHDLLAAVVEKSRIAREQDFKTEQANLRLEAERKAKDEAETREQFERNRAAALHAMLATLDTTLEKETYARREADRATRRARWLAVAAILVAVIAVATFFVGLTAEERSVASRRDADELIKFMQYDLRDNLGKLGQLGMMENINARIRRYHEKHPPEPGDDANHDVAERERSVALQQQGDILQAQGELAESIKVYRDSLAISEKLAKQDPSNAGWQRDLSLSYEKIGDVQYDQGDLAGALNSYRDSLAILEKLAKQDPGDARWQDDLSRGYERVGIVLADQGDLAGALKSHRDGLEIRERLAKNDPDNADWQSGLSFIYINVGHVLRDQGDLAGALNSYRDSLAIRERLAKKDPDNANWQSDLSRGYQSVGDALRDQGDLAGALNSYRDSLAILERLAKQDPGNAGWQRDLAWVYWQTGSALDEAEPKSKSQARAMVEKGRDILRQLKERTGLAAKQQKWLDSIEVDLRKMQE